jgi:hypothetical protein
MANPSIISSLIGLMFDWNKCTKDVIPLSSLAEAKQTGDDIQNKIGLTTEWDIMNNALRASQSKPIVHQSPVTLQCTAVTSIRYHHPRPLLNDTGSLCFLFPERYWCDFYLLTCCNSSSVRRNTTFTVYNLTCRKTILYVVSTELSPSSICGACELNNRGLEIILRWNTTNCQHFYGWFLIVSANFL